MSATSRCETVGEVGWLMRRLRGGGRGGLSMEMVTMGIEIESGNDGAVLLHAVVMSQRA